MSEGIRLYDLASVLRSKNAGPFELTLDVIFADEPSYSLVKESGVLTRELVSQLYGVAPRDVYHVVFFDAARAVKITLRRRIDSGNLGDTDVYGAQQHAPLMDVSIPRGEASGPRGVSKSPPKPVHTPRRREAGETRRSVLVSPTSRISRGADPLAVRAGAADAAARAPRRGQQETSAATEPGHLACVW